MAFRFAQKIFSKFNNEWIAVNREHFVDARSFATKQKSKKKSKKERCPNKTCEQHKGDKKSFWSIFRSKPPKKKPPLETCRKYIAERMHDPDPDFTCIGGTPYRTCGPAYIVQKSMAPKEEICVEPEDKILRRIEAHPALKNIIDPMPPFESVEQRMLDLSEKKLHPFYKRYLSMPPRKTAQVNYLNVMYKSRSGPISDDEVPHHLQFNKDCLNKKNIYYEFKRSEPPRQLLAKMLEMKQNKKPTMEKKKEAPTAVAKPFNMRRALKRNKN